VSSTGSIWRDYLDRVIVLDDHRAAHVTASGQFGAA